MSTSALEPHMHDYDSFSSSSCDISNKIILIHADASSVSDSEASTSGFSLHTKTDDDAKVSLKKRGGWPKGRKRKPEVLNLPPKAPATGYNLYLNEQRKLFKESSLAFHEITKIVGNKWSSLSLLEKQPYLHRAEEDKRRYKEELKLYRQSDAYRAYLAKKRRYRLQNNLLSESDMDATDEIDEEDNEELYCRTCDQWFHNLHNKREHLQGRQHTQAIAGQIMNELDTVDKLPINSFKFTHNAVRVPTEPDSTYISTDPACLVNTLMSTLMKAICRRENEYEQLKKRMHTAVSCNAQLVNQLSMELNRQTKLNSDLLTLKQRGNELENIVSQLWQVPSWFIITDVHNDLNNVVD